MPPATSRPTAPKAASRNSSASSCELERPEAMDDADLEPAGQERAVAPARAGRTPPGRRAGATRRRGRSRAGRAAGRRAGRLARPRRPRPGRRRGTPSTGRPRHRPTRRARRSAPVRSPPRTRPARRARQAVERGPHRRHRAATRRVPRSDPMRRSPAGSCPRHRGCGPVARPARPRGRSVDLPQTAEYDRNRPATDADQTTRRTAPARAGEVGRTARAVVDRAPAPTPPRPGRSSGRQLPAGARRLVLEPDRSEPPARRPR